MNKASNSNQIIAWLKLIRIPNLFTVPGDPLAGFFIAASSGVAFELSACLPSVIASCLLYTAGLISNDYFDLDSNRRDRPERPIPSGDIKPATALITAIILAGLGIASSSFAGLASLATSIVLTIAIILYNTCTKKIRLLGSLNMGLCRGLSFTLGASALYSNMHSFTLVFIIALGLTLYIASVTSIAARESSALRIGWKRWLPPVILTALFILFYNMSIPEGNAWMIISIIVAVLAVVQSLICAITLSGISSPEVTIMTVGKLILNLLIIQAAILCYCIWPAPVAGIILLCFLPVSSILARYFYSS